MRDAPSGLPRGSRCGVGGEGGILGPCGLAVFFGVSAVLDYAHPGSFSDSMLPLFGSVMCLVVAVAAGLITTGMRLRKSASTPEP
jgi:hypothetical protein